MQKPLLIVVTLLILLGIIAAVILTSKEHEPSVEQRYFITEKIQGTDIQNVSIANANGILLTANQIDEQWVATHLGSQSYPLQKQKLADLLQSLQRAKIVEQKSAKAQYHRRLGLNSIDDQSSDATSVSLIANGQQIEMLIGNQAINQDGQYVRMKDASQMWLVDQRFSIPSTAYEWLQPELLSLEKDELIRMSRIDGSGFAIENNIDGANQTGEFMLSGFDASNDELRYPQIVSDYMSDLLSLKFTKVMPYDESIFEEESVAISFELEDRENRIHKLRFLASDEEYLLHIRTYDEQAWLSNWIYTIPAYAVTQINKTYEDFSQLKLCKHKINFNYKT